MFASRLAVLKRKAGDDEDLPCKMVDDDLFFATVKEAQSLGG